MLHDDDDSTSTTSGEEDDETSSENENGEVAAMSVPESPATETLADDDDDDDDDDNDNDNEPLSPVVGSAKKRIKLSLLGRIKAAPAPQVPENGSEEKAASSEPPLKVNVNPTAPSSSSETKSLPPKKKKKKLKLPFASKTAKEGTATTAAEEGEVKAMVVDSDDGGEDDAVAAVVEETSAPKEAAPKKRATNPVRAVRFPPMPSPGLLIPPGSGVIRGTADSNGFTTPASVFEHAMSLAGYTTEERTKRPHRGSSVQREVGDMFDSNVKFSLHFPKLVPEDLLSSAGETLPVAESENQMNGDGGHRDSLPERLMKAFRKGGPSSTTITELPNGNGGGNESHASNGTAPRKRRKISQFSEMVPLSLTIPYPDQYIQKRLEYIEKIKER
jgi:hypothetical protein